jgi:hypothetical protein
MQAEVRCCEVMLESSVMLCASDGRDDLISNQVAELNIPLSVWGFCEERDI